MVSVADLFRKWRGVRKAEVTLAANSPAEHRPQSGLVKIEIGLEWSAEAAPAALVITGPTGEALLRKPLTGLESPAAFWVAVHGQHLPQGLVQVGLKVVDAAGQSLAQKGLTLKVRNEGELARRVAQSLARNQSPVVVDGVCDSGQYPYGDEAVKAWFDQEEPAALAHIERRRAAGEIDDTEAAALGKFVRHGFLILPDVLTRDEIDALNAALDEAIADKHEGYEWGSSQRMHGLHERFPAVRALWRHPKVLRMLRLIYEAEPLPCQSLSYVFGSQQDHHQDTVHLTPFPAGYMCGVWTALEDVQEDSGELVVYPGTHRLARVYGKDVGAAKVTDGDFLDFGNRILPVWARMISDMDVQPEVYRPKAGTVLIWHENLMHAGSVRRDLSKSRRSIVCHYFADGAVAYYDSLGVPAVTHTPDA